MATIILTPEAQEDIRALDGSARKLVLNGLNKLKDSPEQRGAPLGSRVDAEYYDLAVARLEMYSHRPELRDMLQGLLDTAFDARGD